MTLRPPTLFLRLLLLTLPVEAVVLVLFGAWLVRGIERREQGALDQRLRIQSRDLLSRGALDLEGRLRVDTALIAVAPGTFGCLLDEGAAILWEVPRGWFATSGLRALSLENLEYVRSIPVKGSGFRVFDAAKRAKKPEDTDVATGPLLEVILAEPLSGMERSNREFRQKATATGAALLALTGILLWVGIRTGLRPVADMMKRLHDVPGPAGTERLNEGLVLRELRPLAAEINGLLDRLWSMVQREKRFTAEAAHELRTPLTLIKSTLQTALLTGGSREEYERALQEALEDLQRLERTAESLLTLARADALLSDHAPAFEDIGLPNLLHTMAERFAPIAAERALTIALDLHPSVIRGEQSALDRLFGNLVDNAVKYSKPGGTITLRCATDEGFAIVAVEDDGPPVPESDRPHMFQQFFRGASGRGAHVQGAGLGLSIAAAMAHLHGADLAYEPCGREGNRFVVRFPYQDGK